jgi:hypothetical protein
LPKRYLRRPTPSTGTIERLFRRHVANTEPCDDQSIAVIDAVKSHFARGFRPSHGPEISILRLIRRHHDNRLAPFSESGRSCHRPANGLVENWDPVATRNSSQVRQIRLPSCRQCLVTESPTSVFGHGSMMIDGTEGISF